ncbi:optineurin-like [Hylaeus volcanicus]|uniref:optineurin-like n=1 Tax=Hylaeus volcanicus TaxID=313075 RepID=UPI0023B778CE|nr:optineurin-like [Hylaeus volcanicus]XP_053986523.1 optineurin-like [Hylaeus volcanicus]XP_053986524.1 optineurin-like [Hylaeus volcanicus]XP_053986525.1 optineurin-like [Hylaeus volcanicus]
MESKQDTISPKGDEDSKKSSSVHSKLSLEPETHLQSLGFTTNNGKARFILDNDISLCSHSPLINDNVVDESDALSFVVLGKDSLDSIQASSLASYVDIQQKGMSLDVNSMLASWESTDSQIETKLNELLQENEKLKETLKQNNIAMKQQFNTLASWQEEIMRVHQNNKKKFSDMRELINHLKKENSELKMKLSTGQINTETEYEICYNNSKRNEQNLQFLKMNEMETRTCIPETELQEQVTSLTDELNTSKLECKKLSSDVENLLSMSSLMSSQLKQATCTIQEQRLSLKKLEMSAAMSKSLDSNYFDKSLIYGTCSSSEGINNCAECDKCLIKDKEIKSLKESVVLFEHKLQHATAPIQFCIKSPVNPKKYNQQYNQKIQHYKKKLQELTTCFDKQSNHCTLVENHLKNFVGTLENAKSLHKSDTEVTDLEYSWLPDSTEFHHYKNQLTDCYDKLIKERQKFIKEKENSIMVQSEFQNALLDCNSILYELKTLLGKKTEENETQTNMTSESTEKVTESKGQNTEEKQLLEEERISLIKERERLEEEKRLFSNQKRNFEMEYKNLNNAMDLLQQERSSLQAEKSSLDHQSKLCESHYKESLDAKKNEFEGMYNELVTEIGILHETITRQESNLKELYKETRQYMENRNLLRKQLLLYEEDFKQERKIKESLMLEKDKLNTDLQNQIEYSNKLYEEIKKLSRHMDLSSKDHLVPPVISSFSCPKCDCTFRNMESLVDHVNSCLSLD